MAVLSIHREPSLLRAREATDLKALVRSFSTSAKSKVRSRFSHSRSTKSTHTPVAASSKSTASAAHTHGTDNQAPYSSLSQPSTCVSEETTLKPAVPESLDPSKTDYRDSGVAFLPDYSSISRNSTKHTLVIREKDLYPEGIQPCLDVVSSRSPDRIGTETPNVVAVRSLSQSKCSASTSFRLSPTVLQLFLNSAVVSMTAALHLHRGCGEEFYSGKGVLYYSEVRAALRILSKYLGACSKSLDVYEVFAEDSVPRCSEPPELLDTADLLLTGDADWGAPFACSSNLHVATALIQEHGMNQGKRSAPTERSTSNSQKRSRTGRSTAGEGSGQQPRGNGGKRKRNPDEGENNDGNDRGSERAPTEHLGNEGRLTFACPFYKHDPIAHRLCLFRHVSTKTNYVKQHLRRQHMPPKHCPICGEVFETESDKNAHIRRNTCEQREFQHDGLTELQKERIDQIPRNEQPEERWYRMWDIIFPGEQRPASPYIRDPWIEVVETHTALWSEGGGPDRVLGREGVVLSRPGHAVQGQNSANSNAGVWQAFRADMVSSAESFIYSGAEPVYPAASQQLERQSVTESFSSYDIVAPHNNTFSQGQAGSSSIPVPNRDHSGTSRPHPATVDSAISMGQSTGSSASNHGRLYSTGGGVTQRGRRGLVRPQQPATPRISPPQEPQASAWSGGFQGDLATDESSRMLMSGAYDVVQGLDPALLNQSSERAPSMDRALSHSSLPEQRLRMMRAAMAFGGAQGGATGARGGFQAPPGFYGGGQTQGIMQGSRRAAQRRGLGQVDFAVDLGNNQTLNNMPGDLAFSPVFSGIEGTQRSTQGLGQTPDGFGNSFGSGGIPGNSPGAQPEWGNSWGLGQGGMGNEHRLGGQTHLANKNISNARAVPGNVHGVPGAWANIESQGQGEAGGDGSGDGQGQGEVSGDRSGDGQGQVSDECLFDFTYEDPPM